MNKSVIISLNACALLCHLDAHEQARCCMNPVKKLATDVTVVTPSTGKTSEDTKATIRKAYGNVAKTSGSCCPANGCSAGGCCGGGADLSQEIGYSKEELGELADANLGLGCGHPVSLGAIKEGDTVLDLGSGAGLDAFLAAKKVGKKGKVIGVDMTKDMIKKARKNAKKYKYHNVTFRHGDIEDLPVKSCSVDVIISNCVINLAPDKNKVFKEAYRVLKPGGKMAISDVVLTGALTPEQEADKGLLCACVSGAVLKGQYIKMLEDVGFKVTVVSEDKTVNKKWFGSDALPISSLKFIAEKK